MISIGAPQVIIRGGKARLTAMVSVDGQKAELWFEVDQKWVSYLCHERGDAFVVGLLKYAMVYGHDIHSAAPLTESLLYQLSEMLIRPLALANPGSMHPTRLECNTAPAVAKADGAGVVGTGISCGVDSLYVLAKKPIQAYSNLEITHLSLFNFHGATGSAKIDRQSALFRALKTRAQAFCNEYNYTLVAGDTNYDGACLPGLVFDGNATFGVAFAVLSMQKLWRCYFVASGYSLTNFSLKHAAASDCAYYDLLTTSAFSTNALCFYSEGLGVERLEKVKALVDYPPSYRFLNVCWLHRDDNAENCSNSCPKCMRTMLELDALGALDKYRSVFDVGYYRSHFHEYIAELYRLCLVRQPYGLELKPYFRAIPWDTKVRAWGIVFKKIVLKIKRLGKVSKKFSSR